jgi:Tfp pilus assembly protein PilV
VPGSVQDLMKTSLDSRRRQAGAYLLEALIGILIFALGTLGIVGLQAASLHTTADSALRAEAVFAANQLLGQMWTDDEANLINYTSAIAAQPYKDFAAELKSAQGGAYACDPTVQLDNFAAAPSKTSHSVNIAIYWQSETGDSDAACGKKHHTYTTSGVVGQN